MICHLSVHLYLPIIGGVFQCLEAAKFFDHFFLMILVFYLLKQLYVRHVYAEAEYIRPSGWQDVELCYFKVHYFTPLLNWLERTS